MNTRLARCAAIGAALAAAWLPDRVAAQSGAPPPHFVFRVPLDITRMSAAQTAVAVGCEALTAQGTGLGRSDTVSVAIDAQTGRPVQAVAEVPLRLPAVSNPFDARAYRCRLHTHPSVTGAREVVPLNPGEAGIDTSKPRVEVVTGSIP